MLRPQFFNIISVGFVASVSFQCYAEDFENAEFDLRFAAAASRLSNYGDVIGIGGASVGSKFASSFNPASQSWLEPEEPVRLVSPQYTDISFDNDSRISIGILALQWDAGNYGHFAPVFAHAESNRKALSDSSIYEFDSDIGQIGWSKKLSKDWAIGINLGIRESKTTFDIGELTLVKSENTNIAGTIGVLYALKEKLLWGFSINAGRSRARTTALDPFQIDAGPVSEKITTHSIDARTGLSYEFLDENILYVDYQYVRFKNSRDFLDAHRAYLGAEVKIRKFLFARAGGVLDNRENIGASLGVGIYPSPKYGFDIAFQKNMFPEIEREFGKSQLFNISFFYSF